VQYLVNERQYVVLAPAYGPQVQARRTRLRMPVRDVGSLLVWIGLQRELDRSRVALVGEGFGAYVALQSLADYGDRLLAQWQRSRRTVRHWHTHPPSGGRCAGTRTG